MVTDSVVVTVNETVTPDLDSPADLSYEVGTTGNAITWTLRDQNPDVYNVTKNGNTYLADTSWSNGTISVDIVGLATGNYDFTIFVYDDYSNTASDQVFVTVTEANTNSGTETATDTETNTDTETTTTTSSTPETTADENKNLNPLNGPTFMIAFFGILSGMVIIRRKYDS